MEMNFEKLNGIHRTKSHTLYNFHAKNITSTGSETFYAQTIANGMPTGSNYYGTLDDIVQSTI